MSSPAKKSFWTDRIVKWLDECENKIPEPQFLKGDFPEWVQRLSRELLRTLFPEARLHTGARWSEGEIGGILGHQLAYWSSVEELVRRPNPRVFKKIDRKTQRRVTQQLKSFGKCYQKAFERSLALACNQPYGEALEFFSAFARGLSRKPADENATNLHRTTTRIYIVMLVHWQSVERLRSVHDLQQALCKHFGTHTVGKLKRVEKMCQRLGLRFGPRGRPKRLVDRPLTNHNAD